MTDQAATAIAGRADPGALVLEFRHVHRPTDLGAEGVQTWQIPVTAGGEAVGSLRATRGLYWQAGNLRERMADEGQFRAEFEEFVDITGSVLVVDELDLATPWDDPWIVAGLAASVIDGLTDGQFAVVFPRAAPGAALLGEAATLLSAEPFSDDLLVIDTALAAHEEAARRARERLRDSARLGGRGPAERGLGRGGGRRGR
ncbi:hypothetical protein [Streptomyces sp. NPDC057199]|uniref:hypothetical protein n=1 Tax=Streptomyces sp. NPDC057199 TaxID=3346047 RepID=UPI00362BA79D